MNTFTQQYIQGAPIDKKGECYHARTSAVLSCEGKKTPTQLHKKRQGKTIMNNKERRGTGENCCSSVEAEADDWPINNIVS